MLRAPIPDDDAERIRTLREYDILDTPAEPYFDAIAKLAATILDVPIALVSLVDDDRQWFKARYGLAAPETPRDVSFCGHAVADRAAFVVTDALLDSRFADNPLVVDEPHVRFYAGIPLIAHDGHVLGTLCAIDHLPRSPSAAQLDSLRLLAGQVVALLELRRTGQLLDGERRVLADRERQLADRERRLATVLEGMHEGVVLQDRSGVVLHRNRAAQEILGVTNPTGALFDPSWRTTHGDGTPIVEADMPGSVTLKTGRPVTDVLVCVEKAGAKTWLSLSARPLVEAGVMLPYAVITTIRDITEQRALADGLEHYQRLVTTGTLAAGIGHEINNPLSYVLTNISLAIEELSEIAGGSPSKRLSDVIAMLEQSREGADRIRRIVRGLKALAREDSDLVPTDVNVIVKSALQMASHEIRTQASVRLELADVALVKADESRLVQVLINILMNAGQAFETSNPSKNVIIIRTRIDGGVVVEINDNGPGIAPHILPRIFDPFFTTKRVGVGTGLGLAISHGIISALGGELKCESELGRGTTFRIRLPTVVERTSVAALGSSKSGRLLVVDDESTILKSVTRIFESEFEVVAVDDPREALRRIQNGEDFDVVFCDLTMPYLTGMDLYDRVAAIRPRLAARFVFVSGDLTRDDIRQFLARVPNERLEKPVSVQNLRGIARRFVDASHK